MGTVPAVTPMAESHTTRLSLTRVGGVVGAPTPPHLQRSRRSARASVSFW